jgi:hypothetical protein
VRGAAVCVAAAAVLTQVEFPHLYFDLVAGDPSVVALVAVRNGLLIAALSLVLAPAAAPARWRRPAAAASRG